jgi:hypothetical protein
MSGYWYTATPYSKWPAGIEDAYRMACRETARLLKAGINAYSPIAHTHGVAMHGGIDPLSHEIWLAADRPLMDAACGLIVVRATGWEDSYGIGEEIKVFKAAGKPILYIDPSTP